MLVREVRVGRGCQKRRFMFRIHRQMASDVNHHKAEAELSGGRNRRVTLPPPLRIRRSV